MTSDQIINEQIKIMLIASLKTRFEKHRTRHEDLEWTKVQARLEAYPGKLWSLHEMEQSGGEPDVVAFDEQSGEYHFYDCAPESPAGRRSLCYDRQAWEERKEHRPANNVLDMASAMGIEVLTEAQYRYLQQLGHFDQKTSSWLQTPAGIRGLGGAIFGDFRYGQVFIYHNGASSYYAARGFRACLKI